MLTFIVFCVFRSFVFWVGINYSEYTGAYGKALCVCVVG